MILRIPADAVVPSGAGDHLFSKVDRFDFALERGRRPDVSPFSVPLPGQPEHVPCFPCGAGGGQAGNWSAAGGVIVSCSVRQVLPARGPRALSSRLA